MNRMILKFLSRSENEPFARNAVAAFALPLNPSLSELSDVKTAVSEAVTNCIVHGYRGTEGWITLECTVEGSFLHIMISDGGRGIEDVERALMPFYTTLPDEERTGMGFTIMQTFMTNFSVQSRVGEGTTVRMSMDFGARAEANAQ
ncbi:MAG: anti-sigma F factor [Clostridia bacterium]|nr:anti-sigma F factor [Clostridia bacterium]